MFPGSLSPVDNTSSASNSPYIESPQPVAPRDRLVLDLAAVRSASRPSCSGNRRLKRHADSCESGDALRLPPKKLRSRESAIASHSLRKLPRSLDALPPEIIAKIGSYLDFRDYQNLRLTGKTLHSTLPTASVSQIAKAACTERGKLAQQALSLVENAVKSELKSEGSPRSNIIGAIRSVYAAHSPIGLVFNFTITSKKETEHRIIRDLMTHFMEALSGPGAWHTRPHPPGYQSKRNYRIHIPHPPESPDGRKSFLESLFRASHKACSENGSGLETLILACVMSVSKIWFVDWYRISEETWNAATEPYSALLRAGDSIRALCSPHAGRHSASTADSD